MFVNRRLLIGLISMIIFFQTIYYVFKVQMKRADGYFEILSNNDLYLSQRSTSSSQSSINATSLTNFDNVTHVNLVKVNHSIPQFPVTSLKKIINSTLKNENSTLNSVGHDSVFETSSNRNKHSNLVECKHSSFDQTSNMSLKAKVDVSKILYSYDQLEKDHGVDMNMGGHWYPLNCQPNQRLALIVCYRDREEHLKIFLNNIHPFLKKQNVEYTIIVVNQHGKEKFNRGALFNVGYIEAMKLYPFNCFIFHDVDLIPEDLRNIYTCDSLPRHMSVAVDKFNYKLLYSTLFGGVSAFHIDDFVRTNGFPNVYWGWGNEDDDMYLRVTKKLKKNITRYPIEIARYKMIRTHGHKSGANNPFRDRILRSKYDYALDGLNTIRYNLHKVTLHRLFTFINVTLFEESYEQILDRLHIKTNQRKT